MTASIGCATCNSRCRSGARLLLSLGDSLATGVQPTGAEEWQFGPTRATRTAGHDRAAEPAEPADPQARLPRESTATMIGGGLTTYPTEPARRSRRISARSSRVGRVRDHRRRLERPAGIRLEAIRRYGQRLAQPARYSADTPGSRRPRTPIVGMTIYDSLLPTGSRARWDRSWPACPCGRRRAINAHFREYTGPRLAAGRRRGAFATTDFDTEVELADVGTVPVNVARPASGPGGSTAATRPGSPRQCKRLSGNRRSLREGPAGLERSLVSRENPPVGRRRVLVNIA